MEQTRGVYGDLRFDFAEMEAHRSAEKVGESGMAWKPNRVPFPIGNAICLLPVYMYTVH